MQDNVNLLAPDAGVMIWTLVLLGALVTVPIYLFVRWLRAYEKRSASTVAMQPVHASVEALETEVAQLQTDVTNLAAGQDFTMQLLTQRPGSQPNAMQVRDHDGSSGQKEADAKR